MRARHCRSVPCAERNRAGIRRTGFGVLAAAIARGVADLNWQHDTFAYADTYDAEGDRHPGLVTAAQVEVTQSLTAVLVRPDWAMAQLDAESQRDDAEDDVPEDIEDTWHPGDPDPPRPPVTPQPTRFYGRKELDPVRAIRDLGTILEEVTKHLDGTGKEVTLTVEINARSEGYDTSTQRIVKENATQLGFDSHEFEH